MTSKPGSVNEGIDGEAANGVGRDSTACHHSGARPKDTYKGPPHGNCRGHQKPNDDDHCRRHDRRDTSGLKLSGETGRTVENSRSRGVCGVPRESRHLSGKEQYDIRGTTECTFSTVTCGNPTGYGPLHERSGGHQHNENKSRCGRDRDRTKYRADHKPNRLQLQTEPDSVTDVQKRSTKKTRQFEAGHKGTQRIGGSGAGQDPHQQNALGVHIVVLEGSQTDILSSKFFYCRDGICKIKLCPVKSDIAESYRPCNNVIEEACDSNTLLWFAIHKCAHEAWFKMCGWMINNRRQLLPELNTEDDNELGIRLLLEQGVSKDELPSRFRIIKHVDLPSISKPERRSVREFQNTMQDEKRL